MAVINGTPRNDILVGTPEADQIDGKSGHDRIWGLGGNGHDGVDGGTGDDLIDGGNDSGVLKGGEGEDVINGGHGQDYILGGTRGDTLDGDEDDDFVSGGDGDDVINCCSGDDTAKGDFGSDTFFVSPGNHRLIGGEGPDGEDIDVLNLSGAGYYTIEHTGPENGIINFLDDHDNITRRAHFKEIERVICFTPGTGIATMQGERLVEDLKVGDRVFTRDNGAQEIRWIGRKKITLGAGTLSQRLQPILIRKGALGFGLPERNTLVSPNHRILLSNTQAQLYFNESEVLVAAKHLAGMPGIEHWVTSEIEYVHFLCDRHEIVLSNSAWTETFQPGDYSLAGLGDPQRAEIFRLFPELKSRAKSGVFSAARRSLKRYEAELMRY